MDFKIISFFSLPDTLQKWKWKVINELPLGLLAWIPSPYPFSLFTFGWSFTHFHFSLLGEVSLILGKVKSQQSVSSRATSLNTQPLSIFTFYLWVKFHSFWVKFLSFWAKWKVNNQLALGLLTQIPHFHFSLFTFIQALILFTFHFLT